MTDATHEDQNLMFERFTQPARLALFLARVAVSEHGGTAIIDAHLLIGLLKAAPELGPLLRPNVNVQRLSECLVGALAAPSLPPTSIEVPFDAAVKAALREAQRLADGFGQLDITPAHLFLAVLQQPPGVAARCLQSADIDLSATADAVATFARGA
jgi:ATP-dependent Clp protease ATP-binding subunit ClpA